MKALLQYAETAVDICRAAAVSGSWSEGQDHAPAQSSLRVAQPPGPEAGRRREVRAGLYRAMQRSNDFEPVLLARTGPPVWRGGRPREGTMLSMIDEDPNQYFFYT